MILSDFEPCFQVSAHRYRYNPSISYSIIRRGEIDAAAAALPSSSAVLDASDAAGRVVREGPWEVFAHDSRLPGSGWAYLESRVRVWGGGGICMAHGAWRMAHQSFSRRDPQEEEPFRLEVESKYFDSCFYITKPTSAPAENPFREADYADYSDKGLAH